MTFMNSGGLALGKRSSMSLWLKSPSLAQIKPALSADRALGGEGTEYTCFCMFIEFKLTSFPLKDQQSFHKWIFDPLREKKKCGRKKASPFRLTAGEFWDVLPGATTG